MMIDNLIDYSILKSSMKIPDDLSSKRGNFSISYAVEGSETLESMSLAKYYNSWVVNKFKKFLKGDILEVGFGIGSFTSELVNYGPVWAIDVDQEFVKNSKLSHQNLKLGFGDIEAGKYFFGNKKFDTIVCLNVLEHIKNDEKSLNNLYSLLNKNGKLIIIVPSQMFLFGEIDKAIGHFRRYHKNKLLDIMKKIGYRIIYQKRLNLLGSFGWFISGKILRQTKIKKGNIKLFDLIAPLFLGMEKFYEPPIGTSLLIIASK